ncbi:hypothetical protein M9H77_33359 [Catharanthus roseus]|uniref:Uncharacterized protein n=1 Tax=Catharanthus roseus TaxID=4058 RepID=A0ACB9ZJV9_CATRO|nr:hypothetical protein M9H77_33359 [Catharanthus roseus]
MKILTGAAAAIILLLYLNPSLLFHIIFNFVKSSFLSIAFIFNIIIIALFLLGDLNEENSNSPATSEEPLFSSYRDSKVIPHDQYSDSLTMDELGEENVVIEEEDELDAINEFITRLVSLVTSEPRFSYHESYVPDLVSDFPAIYELGEENVIEEDDDELDTVNEFVPRLVHVDFHEEISNSQARSEPLFSSYHDSYVPDLVSDFPAMDELGENVIEEDDDDDDEKYYGLLDDDYDVYCEGDDEFEEEEEEDFKNRIEDFIAANNKRWKNELLNEGNS